MRPAYSVVILLSLIHSNALALEVSTGFLIGPRHDPRAFYFRQQPGGVWQKSHPRGEPRNPAQSLGFQRVHLQSASANSFQPDGGLREDAFTQLQKVLVEAAARGAAVELVLFHPSQDQTFDSPESLERAIQLVTDWLIDHNHRHVILNPGGDWSAPGWDFGQYVPQHAAQFAQVIRDRFQARKTDYLLPVALCSANRLAPTSALVQEADVLIVSGDALASDPRSIERPILVVAQDAAGCASAAQRFSGCLVEPAPVVK